MEYLQEITSYLRVIRQALVDEGRDLIAETPGNLKPCDVVALMSINRAVLLIDGSFPLLDQKNMIAGAALVRMQLDTYLRFHAVASYSDPHKLAAMVLDGAELRKIKGDDNKPMTDAHLVECSEDDDVKVVYEWANGHVHLSDRHYRHLMAASPVQESGKYLFRLGAGGSYITDDLMNQWAHALRQSSGAVAFAMNAWRGRRGQFDGRG